MLAAISLREARSRTSRTADAAGSSACNHAISAHESRTLAVTRQLLSSFSIQVPEQAVALKSAFPFPPTAFLGLAKHNLIPTHLHRQPGTLAQAELIPNHFGESHLSSR